MRYLVCLLIVLSPLWVPVLLATLVATAMVFWTRDELALPMARH